MRIMFKAPTFFDSLGRNRFIKTAGVEIMRLGRSGEADDTLWFSPITSRGDVSEACRVVVAFSAIDEVIDALQTLKGLHQHQHVWSRATEHDAIERCECGAER